MLLAFDTATTTASVAVYDRQRELLLGETTWLARRRHTQDVLLTTQTLLTRLGVDTNALTALAVTTGPGSFTGVRIGLSLVKGLSLGLGTPPQMIGVPTLHVTAAPWLAAAQAVGATVWAIIQAGRGRYNWAIFSPEIGTDSEHWPPIEDHAAGIEAELVSALASQHERPIWLLGEVADTLPTAVASLEHVTLIDNVSALRRAGVLAQIAAERLGAKVENESATLQPHYLQAPG